MILIGALLLACSMTLFVSCQEAKHNLTVTDKDNPTMKAPDKIDSKASKRDNRQTGGTKTGGADAIDLSSLPCFTDHIQPILDNLQKTAKQQALDPVKGTQSITLLLIKNFFNTKKWQIKTTNQNSFIKTALSTNPANGDVSKRIVTQTKDDIWIDLGRFLAKHENEQAEILLREWVTTLYLLKYKRLAEACQILNRTVNAPSNGGVNACSAATLNHLNSLDRRSRQPTAAPLTAADYSNIENITNLLLESPVTYEVFLLALQENNFDVRLTVTN
jgi:hypothetical protein